MRKPKTFRVDFMVTTFVTAKGFTEAMKKGRKAVAKGKIADVKFEYAIGSSKNQTRADFIEKESHRS